MRSDLGDELDFVADDSVDVVLRQHVLSHLEDPTAPVTEFARVLADGGDLVVSTHDPVHDYRVVRDGEYSITGDGTTPDAVVKTGSGAPNYAETERYDVVWSPDEGADRATYYRRSVEDLVSPPFDAGFESRDLAAPTPGDTSSAIIRSRRRRCGSTRPRRSASTPPGGRRRVTCQFGPVRGPVTPRRR